MPTKGYKSEIRLKAEELLKDFTPAQVAKNLFTESGWNNYESFGRKIRQWKKELEQSPKEFVRNYVRNLNEAKTTKSNEFHKLKTELGLHDNEFGFPAPLDDEIKIHTLPVACNKILLLSDVHLPFHSVEALTTAIKYGKDRGANCIYLNGDMVDMYAISRFEKEKRLRDLNREIEMTREFLSILRSVFPNIPIYYKLANHEMRWNLMIRNNAKEFEGVKDFEFNSVFRFDNFGIHEIGEKDIMKMASLYVIHGHEMFGGGGVNPSRSLFLKTMRSTLMSHVHRTSEYSGKDISGKFITCWSTGCLSQLRPKYNPLSQYNHGATFIETHGEDFHVNNFRIENGKIL